MIGRLDDEALAIRKRWGVLFQGGALFSTLTVAENVEVPIREYYPNIGPKLRDEIAAYKIRLTGLPAEAGPKYPAELSGGMKKRAGLARALALDRSEEHTSELQSLMRISYAVFCLKKKKTQPRYPHTRVHCIDSLCQ